MKRKGSLLVLAATSGTGKTTVSHRLLEVWPNAEISVSYTTRKPRMGEQDGIAYHFVSREHFTLMIEKQELVEWAEVHGNYYGTGKDATHKMLNAGKDILLDIDVQGAQSIREQFREQCILVFLLPPSWEAMLQRLRGRGTDDETEIAKRVQTARLEMPLAQDFDYLVVNEDLEEAVQAIASILHAVAHRTPLMQDTLQTLLQTMP